jgi:hypothetical protein
MVPFLTLLNQNPNLLTTPSTLDQTGTYPECQVVWPHGRVWEVVVITTPRATLANGDAQRSLLALGLSHISQTKA